MFTVSDTRSLENGMVLNQDRYDPQCRPLPYLCGICRCECNELVPFRSGVLVCEECYEEHRLDFADEYVKEHPAEYYLRWWFANRDEGDLLRIAMEEYRKEEAIENQMGADPGHSLAADRRDFCNEETYYDDFAKGAVP